MHDKPWILDPDRPSRSRLSESSEDERSEIAITDQKGLTDIDNAAPVALHESERPLPVLRVQSDQQTPMSYQPLKGQQAGSLSPLIPGKGSKMNVAKSAKKVWNTLTNRKTSEKSGKNKDSLHEAISPYFEGNPDHTASIVSQNDIASSSRHNDGLPSSRRSRSPSNMLGDAADTSDAPSLSAAPAVPHKSTFTTSEVAPVTLHVSRPKNDTESEKSERNDLLRIDVAAPRLRKSSSRKSIRKSAAAQAVAAGAGAGRSNNSATSPRSRRSSLYSFDLDVETPRSDSFDFPRSPLSPMGNGIVHAATAPVSPVGGSGVLSISPVAFGALMEGAMQFGESTGDASAASGSLTPGTAHRRHKSASSVTRRSRPVSVASDRTGPSPRVSKRFSKRASILPPPALDLLKESPHEPVPKIPDQYKTPTSGTSKVFGVSAINSAHRAPSPPPYAERLHAYAIRGLREYEDCLDEWELFVHRAKEEEGVDGREVSLATA